MGKVTRKVVLAHLCIGLEPLMLAINLESLDPLPNHCIRMLEEFMTASLEVTNVYPPKVPDYTGCIQQERKNPLKILYMHAIL